MKLLQTTICARKSDDLGKVDKFLDTYELPKLNQEETENLNRLITTSEIETVFKKFTLHKNLRLDDITGEFYKIFNEEITPIPLRLFLNIQEEGRLQMLSTRPVLS